MINEQELDTTVGVWLDILQDVPFEIAKEKTRDLCRINKHFAPTPAEIYQACYENPSYYDLLRQEDRIDQLALQAYNEQAVPMPDHIRERLERRAARKVNSDES